MLSYFQVFKETNKVSLLIVFMLIIEGLTYNMNLEYKKNSERNRYKTVILMYNGFSVMGTALF